MDNKTPTNPRLPITVVISTFNRPVPIVNSVKSLLDNDYANFELIVVDQSTNTATEEILKKTFADPRLIYIRSESRGVGAGRNEGIQRARSEIIAITDDDCEVPVNWIRQISRAFEIDERVGCIFGTVLAGKHDSGAGFIPTYEVTGPFMTSKGDQQIQIRGMGACSALRRSAWFKVNGYDDMLGPGAPFKSAEDRDIAIKLVEAGYYICETPDLKVVHHGFRTWREGRDLAARDWFGIGAALAKHVKCGNRKILPVIYHEWVRIAMGTLVRNLVKNRRLSGVTPVVAFLHGFIRGLMMRVDPVTHNYTTGKRAVFSPLKIVEG